MSTTHPTRPAPQSASRDWQSTTDNGTGLLVVRPEAEVMGRQSLPFFLGVSAASTGATGISMNLVVIPPNGAAEPHSHRGYESAIYMMKGELEVRHGPGLVHSTIVRAGDFIFLPADLPHQPVNLSPDEPALAIVSRNDPNEQENIELFR